MKMRCSKCDGSEKIMSKSGMPSAWFDLHVEGDVEVECDECGAMGVQE